MAGKRKTYTAEFKLAAVKMITGSSPSPRSCGDVVSARTCSTRGRRPLPRMGPAPSPDPATSPVEEENRRLEAEVKRLTAERDILKTRPANVTG